MTLQARVTSIVAAGVAAALIVPAAVVVTVLEPSSWRESAFLGAFFAAAVASVGVSVVIGRVATRAVLVPLETTIAALESAAEGATEVAEASSSVEELDRLRHLVNRLVARTRERERSSAIAAGALAHDVRASLLAVRRALALASDDREGSAVNKVDNGTVTLSGALVESMEREIDRVHALTSDLVMVMRSEPVVDRTHQHSIVDAVERVVQVLRPQSSVPIDVIATRPFARPVSPTVLDRLFRNVIDNAAKAARSRVSVEVLEGLVIVADDGPGMPAALLESRTTLSGLRTGGDRADHGFGMAIAHRLAELAGGKLLVEKSDERGTTLLVYL